jgi:hypothetical protein
VEGQAALSELLPPLMAAALLANCRPFPRPRSDSNSSGAVDHVALFVIIIRDSRRHSPASLGYPITEAAGLDRRAKPGHDSEGRWVILVEAWYKTGFGSNS